MTLWTYVPDLRLTKPQQLLLEQDKQCRACASRVLRLAEREADWPYHWKPKGYRCSKCNTCYLSNK